MPIGINTGLVESQTSYISRLAETHCVNVGTLIGKEIAPIIGKKYLLRSIKNGGSRFYDFGIELNGFGKQATDFSKILSELTGINTINQLTLMQWNGIIPVKDTLRRKKAWCPICLENMKNSGFSIYEPLIWNIKAVKICGVHKTRLKTICPLCGKEIPVLSRKSRNGFCSFCGCWLGSIDNNINEDMDANQLSLECFVEENIKNLIKMGSVLKAYPSEQNIFIFLKSLIEEFGGINAFSKYFAIPASTVEMWIEKKHKPLLYTLLKICYHVGINITDIVDYRQTCINYISASKENYPAIVDKTVNKILEKRKIDWFNVENILKEIINCNTEIQYSVCEVAKNMGCSKRSLYIHFPDLCKMISTKHASYVHMMKSKRIEKGCKKICEITISLYKSGVYPSRRKVESLLPTDLLLRESAFQNAWKETMVNLGLINN